MTPFAVGDLVLAQVTRAALRDPNVQDAGVPKLGPRFLGPFPISEVLGPATYRLELPARIRCHRVFNVSKLKAFVANTLGGREPVEPGPVDQDEQGQ